MKILTIAIPLANTATELKTTLESLCGIDSRLEILVVYDPCDDRFEKTIRKYQSRYPEVRAVKTYGPGRDGVMTAAIGEAISRNFKVVEPGDTIPEGKIRSVLDELESCEADVFFSGLQTPDPKTSVPIVRIPELDCSGRQIDMIRLSEKFEDIKQFLGFPCLIFNTDFLKEVRKKVSSAQISGDLAFTILPFIYAESMMIIPESFYEQKRVFSGFAKELPEAVQNAVEYYESCKPLGKARSEFLNQWFSLDIIRSYVVLLAQSDDKQEGFEKAENYRSWLKETSPVLAKNTERKYRMLRLKEKYRRLFHCKNTPTVVESCHV